MFIAKKKNVLWDRRTHSPMRPWIAGHLGFPHSRQLIVSHSNTTTDTQILLHLHRRLVDGLVFRFRFKFMQKNIKKKKPAESRVVCCRKVGFFFYFSIFFSAIFSLLVFLSSSFLNAILFLLLRFFPPRVVFLVKIFQNPPKERLFFFDFYSKCS